MLFSDNQIFTDAKYISICAMEDENLIFQLVWHVKVRMICNEQNW